MTSLCRHLSAQEIVNWVTTADGCVHTDDTTKLSPTSCEFVFTPPTPTRQNSFVPSASAVCIGHKTHSFRSFGRVIADADAFAAEGIIFAWNCGLVTANPHGGAEFTGQENDGQICRDGKCRTGN